ncbi:hypothetical protein BKA70DRAFT_1479570 [Coprinopsis sp. MPI-PUGE-AT-0042]|nr:hypothetical protein BKA70DRAFT_1479570 [Coprinopsis sp. MPI-PUGE-AT-0042]
MSSTPNIDARILPYISNNDPLPVNLKPVLDKQLDAVRVQANACDTCVNKGEDRIRGLQHKIQDLEREIADIREEQGRQVETKNNHNGLIQKLSSTTSAVRRLPSEIIASFISLSVWDDYGTFEQWQLRWICKVSRLWRSSAISTPSLWRNLSVGLGGHFSRIQSRDEAKLHFANTLNAYLSRGGQSTGLELSFSGPDNLAKRQQGVQTSDVVDWIKESRFNFVSLTFHEFFCFTMEIRHLLSTNPPSLRSLKKLDVGVRAVSSAYTPEPDIRPAIDEAATGGPHSCLSIQGLIKFNLEHVRVTVGEVKSLLKDLPSLESLSLKSCSLSSRQGDGQAPFVHASIREITLAGELLGHCLNGITCPSLERLNVKRAINMSSEGSDLGSAQAMGNFLQRSQLSNITLHLGFQLRNTFLNTLLSTSKPTIATIDVPAIFALSLIPDPDGTRVLFPHSIQSIQCQGAPQKKETTTWMRRLALCLEDPSRQRLSVKFGEGSSASVKQVKSS